MPGDSFQDIVMRLNRYWADQGCIVQEPYDVEIGAGTMAPATFLRVLGPEPWNVAYPQGCRRPADGRYADNPNRYQHYFQYQVILKPCPPDPQGLYLNSLEALGIQIGRHDVRFVEDNWESPALGAWGLGWEVWLDGLEITQFTYFQQAGGLDLDPPAVELTYGLERIAMYLQEVRDIAEIRWAQSTDSWGALLYGDLFRDSEVQHCTYNFEQADVGMLQQLFELYEAEARRLVETALVAPALDYLLKCSHVFNLLDSRGAVGVAQRAAYFGRMRALARGVANAHLKRRQELGFPLGARSQGSGARGQGSEARSPRLPTPDSRPPTPGPREADFVFEIGTEELPPADLDSALEALREEAPRILAAAGFAHEHVEALGTPRRLILLVPGLRQTETDREETVKGPPATAAFDAEGRPTRAAEGFARNAGVAVADLQVEKDRAGEYVVARLRLQARPAQQALADACLALVRSLTFSRPMYWDDPMVVFSRPIRWLAPIWGQAVVPLEYAGLSSGRVVRGPRHLGSPELEIESASQYPDLLRGHEVEPSRSDRLRKIVDQVQDELKRNGADPDRFDPRLAREVTNLVEWPYALLGEFDPEFLALPEPVLAMVMQKHQRYFPVYGLNGTLQSRFVAVVNGQRAAADLELIRRGNEEVLRARFADALFFWKQDQREPFESYVSKLETITFQEKLGSLLDKTERLKALAPEVAGLLGWKKLNRAQLERAAHLGKADLATGLVRELPDLQGVIGREYAQRSGERESVAEAIFEHYLPRFPGDELPRGRLGIVLGLADRADTLVTSFAAGLEPTGSSDPYGLRRAALGLLQLALERGLDVSLSALVDLARPRCPIPLDDSRVEALREFLRQRLRVLLRGDGLPLEVVDSALSALGDRPWAAASVARALPELLKQPEVARLVEALKRAARIQPQDGVHYRPDPDAISQPAEKALYAAVRAAEPAAKVPVAELEEFIGTLQPLAEPIHNFLDQGSGVMVMDPDERVRANRLGLLRAALDLAAERFDVRPLT